MGPLVLGNGRAGLLPVVCVRKPGLLAGVGAQSDFHTVRNCCGEIRGRALLCRSDESGGQEMFAGYKTYIVAAAILGLAMAKYVGVEVPAEVWLVLNALGLGFLRAALDEPKA
jgi:hypothetical protein